MVCEWPLRVLGTTGNSLLTCVNFLNASAAELSDSCNRTRIPQERRLWHEIIFCENFSTQNFQIYGITEYLHALCVALHVVARNVYLDDDLRCNCIYSNVRLK